MRNRNLAIKKLEELESTMSVLEFIVKRREPLSTYTENLKKANDTIEFIKSMIEKEPVY